MSATKAPQATRYFQPGTTKIYILLSIANLATGPTRAELNAGTDVSDDVSGITGWMTSSANIATPDLGKRRTGNIPGRITIDDSSITFYASKDGEDIRKILVRDGHYYVVVLDGGDVEDYPMDVFDTTVASVGKMRDIEDAPKLQINFTIADEAENLEVPAAA